MTSFLLMTKSSQRVKFLKTPSGSILLGFFFKSSQYSKNLLLVELVLGFFFRVCSLHIPYNYTWRPCLKIQFYNGRCLFSSQLHFEKKNYLTKNDIFNIIIKRKERFPSTFHVGKNWNILLHILITVNKFWSNIVVYSNIKCYQIFLDSLYFTNLQWVEFLKSWIDNR